ncbi:hypothetical protein Ciccas_007518, partial [Cichlidogyrus casuarinus]
MKAWLYLRWPAVWGIYTHNVHLDLSLESTYGGGYAGWYADRGDKAYTAIATGSPTPYAYIPYGICVINALSQVTVRHREWNLHWRIWQLNNSPNSGPADTIVVPLVPSQYVTNLRVLQPGALPTYSWRLNSVLAPTLAAADVDRATWRFIRTLVDKLSLDAGVILPLDTPAPIIKGVSGFGALFTNLFDDPSATRSLPGTVKGKGGDEEGPPENKEGPLRPTSVQ